jgi:hypothetical protein
MSTLYDVLQVPRGADDGTIRAAWRAQVKSTHPDVGGSAEAFAVLEAAYRTLSDPTLRADYDRQLAHAERRDEPVDDSFTIVDETIDDVFVTDEPHTDLYDPDLYDTDLYDTVTPPPWAPVGPRRPRPPQRPGRVVVSTLAFGLLGALVLLARAVQLHTGHLPAPAPGFVVTSELFDRSMLLFGAVELAAALGAVSVVLHLVVAVLWRRTRRVSYLAAVPATVSGLGCVVWLAVPLVLVVVSVALWVTVGLAGLWIVGTVLSGASERSK